MQAVVPTLGNTTMVTTPQQIIATLIQFYFAAPKHAFSTPQLHEMTISYRDALSRYGQTNISQLKNTVNIDLTSALQRIFGSESAISIDVNHETLGSDNRYNLLLDARVTIKGFHYTISRTISIDDAGRLIVST